MTEDDRIDEIIRNAASDYNRPPAVPRDEMWAAIEAARETPGPRLHVTAGGAGYAYTKERKFAPRFAWIGIAAAAVLLIATGIGIGRWTNRADGPVRIADAPAPVPVPVNDEIKSASPATSEPAPVEQAPQQDAPRRSQEDIKKNPVLRSIKPPTPLGGRQLATAPSSQPQSSMIYQVATLRHLADAEALLTSFSLGESRDATMNAKFADWAKGLLSNTRLLLDSPAGDDPRRAKLLQDLELVLAQIVQLSPAAAATDRELIQGSIQEGQVITRLRTAIPADSAREILER
jgi:hypothetical protein